MALDDDIERVLWTEKQISERVSDLAFQISNDFRTQSSTPVFVGVATGACLFLADLVRKISLPLTVDFIRAESYGYGTESNGNPRVSLDFKIDVAGRHVILVSNVTIPYCRLSYSNLFSYVFLMLVCF